MRGLILTCKHHDGFCLWPSKYTEHSVKNSPWKDGKGDVVREISDACRRHGLKFGVYLSPWDRNHKDYGRPEYIAYYRNQLRELLTNYGPIFEVWFDGANGGDGYYGGARETRHIDNRTYYDWENTWKIVRELQPDACMFSDGGPDVRWVGNESGFAGETCWATLDRAGSLPGVADAEVLNRGQRPGTHWLPAEVDVSIRPGWFYHAREDAEVKSVAAVAEDLLRIGRPRRNLILNVPPDRRGQIHENDVQALCAMAADPGRHFRDRPGPGRDGHGQQHPRQRPAVRAGQRRDGNRDTYWATDDGVTTPELVLDLAKPVTFNVVRVREYLPWDSGSTASPWTPGTTAMGGARLGHEHRQPAAADDADVTTSKVRLRITKAAACPAISEIGLFLRPGE